MKNKNQILKIVSTSLKVFNPSANYEFKNVNGIKIETVESFLKRGGKITYIGTFSEEEHTTNNPQANFEVALIKKVA